MRGEAKPELTALLSLAAASRLAALWLGGPSSAPQEGYYAAALTWLRHGVFTPDAANFYPQPWRGPLYPAFAAFTQWLHAAPVSLALAQAALSVLGVWAAYGLGRKLHSREAGLLAALALIVDPSASSGVWTFDLHYFYGYVVLALACAAAYWSTERPVLYGLVFGLSLLCRTTHFPALLAARKPRALALAAAGALLAMSPYLARNLAQFGRPALDSSHGAYSLYAAATGIDDTAEIERVMQRYSGREMDPDFQQQTLLTKTIDIAWSDPGRYAAGMLRRLWMFWRPLSLALLLIALGWRRSFLPPALVLVSFSLYSLLAVQPRYVEAARPLALTLAACGLASLLKRPAAPADDRAPAALGGALAGCWAVMLVLLLREASLYGWPTEKALLDPSPSKRMTARGIRLYQKGDAAGAAAAFREALRLDPNDKEAAMSLSAVEK